MLRMDVEQGEVLKAVAAHLRSDEELGLADDSQVFIVIDPNHPVIPHGGDFWLSVTPGDGRYDPDLAVGGVVEQCMEESIVGVYGYSRIHLDKSSSDEELLLNPDRGLLSIKKKILKSVAGVDLQIDGVEFARGLLTPNYATSPGVGIIDEGGDVVLSIGIVGVHFSLPFDWDLS